ncbi:MAG: SIMPL domain-containing protein [Ignavibacteriales bacterium]|nr:SIMPL domain-containing protein [Ignavibacteriales bacterium]MCB9219362.1 SIMPL domain-containing protein [Ignavibacteriales bacterium]MCB9260249.1 SIMPL domain-containing protein [Ignavibacteriales bacterium]
MESSNKLTLAIGLVISSLILGFFFYVSRNESNTVKVVGYASESFESDIIRWNFNVTEISFNQDLKNGYARLNKKINDLKNIINSNKLEDVEIILKPISINDIYDRDGITNNKKLSQEVLITSKSLEQIEELSTNPSIFIENNVLFEFSNIEYYYSKLDDLKKELLGKAIINAKERAHEILSATNHKVGDLRTARSGVFQITEPLSTEVAAYGLYSTATKKKNIKVTVSADFDID